MSLRLYNQPSWGVCDCGHYNWQHDDVGIAEETNMLEYPSPLGKCWGKDCTCKRFSFKRVEANPEITEKGNPTKLPTTKVRR